MSTNTIESVENTATKLENTEINVQKDTTLINSELDENSNTTKSNNISLEEKLIINKIIYAQSINKTPIIIKEINVWVNVKLSIYEKES